jgi:hypothetical protein
VAGFISEWWPTSNRNGGRHQIAIGGRIASEFAVVLQIKVCDFAAGGFKGDAPVSRNRNAPCPGPVAGKLMDAPAGWTFQPLDGFNDQQGGQDAADPVDQIAADAPFVVILDKMFQPSMPDSSESSCLKVYG